MKKILACILAATMLLTGLTACGNNANSSDTSQSANESNTSNEITVVSREDGSGTRSAFIELFEVEQDDSDKTTPDAIITNNTAVMLSTVQGNEQAIGYVSLGSMNDSVKSLLIGGAEASVENIKNKTYQISRPFNIINKPDANELAKDFMSFILSSEGQAVVEKNGYITSVDNAHAYSGTKPKGKIVVAGSSSVTPVMEKLKEAYESINADASIEVQQSDSSMGIANTSDGLCDIGMASRELKEEEQSLGLTSTAIAIDGIAVIVNNSNSVSDLSKEQVKDIFTGTVTDWAEVTK